MKIDLDASMEAVNARLAGKFQADVVSTGKTADPYSAVGDSNSSIGSSLEEDEQESE